MRYYEEIKLFSRTFFYFIAVIVIAGLWLMISGISNAGWAVVVAALIPLLFGRLVIAVTGNTLHIEFGYLGLIKKDIMVSEIRESRIVDYRPLRQFGGWGIRCGRFEGEPTACYSLKGNRGLLLSLAKSIKACLVKTDRVLIGCNDPEKLKEALGK